MTELKERFSLADEIDARDLWNEARRRAAAPDGASRAVAWPPGIGRRIAVGAVAFAVFASALVFAWDLSHPDPSPMPPPSTEGFDLSAFPTGWTRLSDPPEVRSVAATTWTGSELLIWGGYEYTGYSDEDAQHTGYRFDPATEKWSPLPDSPLDGRIMPASAWTGREFLVWGGWDGGFREDPYFADGAAYDPTTETWRLLSAAPIAARAPFSVWTGEELIVWGSQVRDRRYEDGAAYDPRTDSWRRIADAPIELTDATAVWTGEVMIVFGAALHGGNFPESPTAIGAAYDPEADSWSRIADSDLSPQASTVAWDGTRMIAWDYENRSASYDPATDTWERVPKIDMWTGECSPVSVGLEGAVFGDYCGNQVVHSRAQGRWLVVSRRPTPGDIVVPIPAGPVAFVLEHDREAKERRMFIYRPPAPIEDGTGGVLQPAPFLPDVRRDGNEVRMPLAFPDGTRATLVFPGELGLEEVGVQPDVSYIWRDDPSPRYPIVFLHDPNASIRTYVGGGEPIAIVDGREVWAMSDEWESHRNQLQGVWVRLRLDSWTVLLASTTVEDAVAVADYLHMDETLTGFPVVVAVGPVALATGFGESEGPQLGFGEASPEPDRVSQLDAAIFLSPDGCNGGSAVSGTYASLCLAGENVFASIYGDREFVRSAFEGLRVQDFRQA